MKGNGRMNEQFLYPQNLKSQAKLWLWNLRDLVIIGTALLVSVLAIAQLKTVLPLGLTLGYAYGEYCFSRKNMKHKVFSI